MSDDDARGGCQPGGRLTKVKRERPSTINLVAVVAQCTWIGARGRVS